MNPGQLINLAEMAILQAAQATAFRWIIVIRHKRILCIPKRGHIAEETVIMELTQEQVRDGLTIDGWNTLGHSLTKYWKEQSL